MVRERKVGKGVALVHDITNQTEQRTQGQAESTNVVALLSTEKACFIR